MDAIETEKISHMIICYILDGFLMTYCICVTFLFFREKYKNVMNAAKSQDKNAIYQELDRPKDADPYQVLEPTKGKKKGDRKKKSQPNQTQQSDKDLYESLTLKNPPPSSE